VLKSLVKAFGLIAGLAISGAVCAVGMGGINVSSSLGEPLKAEIELVAVGKTEKGSLVARLASPDMFKGAGMDYPANLPKLKFNIETRANGESYLGLATAQPVNEPFVSVLIELSWSSGKLLREYTFLLDPPEFSAKQPEAAEVKPVLSRAAETPAMQMRATAPLDEKAFAEAPAAAAKPAAAPTAAKTAASSNVATGTIKVKRGDTLSQIALDTKPSGISLERMLLALYRANGEAFDGNNMNRLKTGKILRLPEQTDLNKVTQMEAAEEFRAQVADWNAYRQKLAAASASGTDQASKQEAAGKISTAIADKSSAAQEPAKEVVRLSKGEAPGDKAVVNGNTKAMQEKIYTLEEEATARNKALKESNERVAALEKNIKEMQRLIELKSQPALPTQSKTAPPAETKAATKPEAKPEPPKVEVKPAAPAPVAASQPAAAPAVAVAASAPASTAKADKPAAKPAAPKVEPPPPSLLDDPVYLAAGAAALLALGGLGFALSRRGKGAKPAKKATPAESETPVDVGSATGRIIAPPSPSPETGDFTQSATAAPVSPAQTEDVDPLSEAELFLTFGRDAQAEEILKDALEKNPANNPVRLKLLSVYANRKDTNSFSVIARQIEASGDAAAWSQAAEMGRNLEPGNPMYGGTGGEPVVAAAADQGMSEPPPAAGLDFDLGFGAPETAASADNEGVAAVGQPGEKTSTGLDFDLGAEEPGATIPSEYTSTLVLSPVAAKQAADSSSEVTLINTQEDLRAAQEAPMDFDVSGGFAAQTAEPEKPDLDDLVFDITASQPSPTAIEEGAATNNAAAEDKTVAFALDFPTEPAQAAAKEAIDFDLGSISLDLGAPASAAQAPAADIKDAHWHDVATKLDLAKAYQEMGDNAGAREILEEVMAEGDEQQRAAAEAINQQLLA
jgi:pilus assembly protein FimV